MAEKNDKYIKKKIWKKFNFIVQITFVVLEEKLKKEAHVVKYLTNIYKQKLFFFLKQFNNSFD